MKKSIVAILAALIITSCVGIAILAVGGAALMNKNSSPASNSPVSTQNTTGAAVLQQTDQVAQLQSLVSQYQSREQQLQSQLDQANAQIQADQQMVQQAQELLAALQQRGLIRVTTDGQIFITQ
jgi:TolA-binding protein